LLDEHEKNSVKRLFKKFDKDKSGALSIDELKELVRQLCNDEAIIGKVPQLSDSEVRPSSFSIRLKHFSILGTKTRMGRSGGRSSGTGLTTGSGGRLTERR